MNRTSFFAALAAVALAAGFVACDKNKDKSNDNNKKEVEAGYRIEASVTGNSSALSRIKSVKASVYVFDTDTSGHYAPIAAGSCTNGKLSITLPATLKDEYLRLLAKDAPAAVTISDRTAKMATAAEIAAFDASNKKIGEFNLRWTDSTRFVTGVYSYVDRACNINGTDSSRVYAVSLKKGWNFFYNEEGDSTSRWSSTKPAGVTLKWSYNSL
ncbi:MAG: hypothetical protein LBH06_07670 [Rikenellaceae bacterium]|jgi:hypothetical protein|nr:hypothetical protein [Rikenellaceae bacterium]